MATQPRPDQLEAFAANKPDGPLYMLNLLKFKDRAEYADDRETELTGQEAYGLYGAAVSKIILGMGGSFEFTGATNVLVVGDGELEWDSVAIAKYPSFEDFQKMLASEAYQEIHVHRDAGLAHQLLINCLDPKQIVAAGRA